MLRVAAEEAGGAATTRECFGEDFLLCSSSGQAAARRGPRRIGAIALKSSEKPHFFQIIRHPQKRVGQGGQG